MARKAPVLPIKTTILGAAEEALSTAEDLRDQLQEWLDNLPESLQGGDKASQLEEAISQLEEAISALEDVQNADSQQALDYEFEYTPVVYPKSTYMSRAKVLEVDTAALQYVPTDTDGIEFEEESEDDTTKQDEFQEVLDKVQEAVDALGSVEFPSMY